VVWRTVEDVPDDLIFRVSYLGGDMPTFALNFSRPGAQVLLQYYMFLRLGRTGFTAVQSATRDVALYLSGEIRAMGPFELWNDGSDIPVFAWKLRDGYTANWDLYNLSEQLRSQGWLVPAYPMPRDLTDLTVQRIVVRNGLGHNLARDLITDLRASVRYLDALDGPVPVEARHPGFHH
jgi:glutamate decarboxylase